MLALFIFILAASDTTFGLSCITNCSIEKIPFDQELRIPDGQCLERESLPSCYIDVLFNYQSRTYDVNLPDTTAPRDTILISSESALVYTMSRECSDETDCAFTETRKGIRALTRRSYDAMAIYNEIAPIIKTATPSNPVKCFNMSNGTETCASGDICGVEYDRIVPSVRIRGCTSYNATQVYVYDSPTYTSFDINWNRASVTVTTRSNKSRTS